jgi:hypothetical protein
MLMAASLTPPAQAASPGPRGVNDCFLSISTPYETADCDYVGAGLFTVIDFSQYSGDIDATVSYTAYSSYYDYSTHEEVLTGPTSCHVAIFEYVPGSGGSGSLHIHNKYE